MKTKQLIIGAFCSILSMVAYGQRSSATITSSGPTVPPQDVAYLQSQFINGMADFVEAVRPFYEVGDTYVQFKNKVLSGYMTTSAKTTLPVLPEEGEGMLFKAYTYLKAGKTATDVLKEDDGKTMGQAYVFTLEERQKGQSELAAQAALFGGDAAALDKSALGQQLRKRCKWWQIWCHVISVVTWVNDHAEDIVTAVSSILTIINMF